MAISAVRFKCLDKETNVPVSDFLSVTDSASLNAAVDNMMLNTGIVPVSLPEFNLEDTVKKSLNSLKTLINGDFEYSDKLRELGKDLEHLIPPGIKLQAAGMFKNFKNAFNKISNLGANSLCSLINAALGLSVVDMLFNLSKDMRKRLFMMALLALMSKMCNTALNSFDSIDNFIDKSKVKDLSKTLTSNLLKSNSVKSLSSFLPKGNNPIMQVVNNTKAMPNALQKALSSSANSKLSLFA